jgi:hypothetical protein
MPISPTALILVAVMNDPRDWEIARLLGWYRIPLKNAPKVVAVDYVAFYQTGAFGESKWRIEFAAPLRGHELTTRAELLRDEPNHPRAHEEYYKLALGPVERLPRPILADKWRRVTFLYTTGEYLLRAETLHDLVIQSDERRVLWQALRERAEAQQVYQIELPLHVDAAALAMLLGIREISEGYSAVDESE